MGRSQLGRGSVFFDTQQACFAALEREQLTHDRVPIAGVERYYRCSAPTANLP